MTTYMCKYISLTNVTSCKYDIPIDTVSTQSRVKSVPSEGSHAEGIGGSIRTRHSALLEVMDHSRCSKVFTIQSHERSLGRRHLVVPRAITRKKTSVTWMSSQGIAPQKPNRRTPVQGSQEDEGSGGTCSSVAPCAQRYGTEKAKGLLRCGLSRKRNETVDYRGLRIYGCDGKGERQRRIPGDGKRKRR